MQGPDLKIQFAKHFEVKNEQNVWKDLVKRKVMDGNAKELKADLLKYRKLEESEILKEEFGRQPYIKQLDLANVRTKFKFRTKMTQHVKMNFSSSTL